MRIDALNGVTLTGTNLGSIKLHLCHLHEWDQCRTMGLVLARLDLDAISWCCSLCVCCLFIFSFFIFLLSSRRQTIASIALGADGGVIFWCCCSTMGCGLKWQTQISRVIMVDDDSVVSLNRVQWGVMSSYSPIDDNSTTCCCSSPSLSSATMVVVALTAAVGGYWRRIDCTPFGSRFDFSDALLWQDCGREIVSCGWGTIFRNAWQCAGLEIEARLRLARCGLVQCFPKWLPVLTYIIWLKADAACNKLMPWVFVKKSSYY